MEGGKVGWDRESLDAELKNEIDLSAKVESGPDVQDEPQDEKIFV